MLTREKRLKLLQDRVNELSFDEQVELISYKYNEKLKLTYEEFVLLAFCDEIEFFYNDYLYQIDYGVSGVATIFIIKYNGNKKVSEQSEEFSSIIDLLDRFRIEGKRIRDIWDAVSY